VSGPVSIAFLDKLIDSLIDIVAASSEDQSKQLDLALSEIERIFSEQGMSYFRDNL